MTDLTRRSFLKGLGAISVTLLWRLDNVLDSLTAELSSTPPPVPRLPQAADIVVTPQLPFRARRIVVPDQIAGLFVIENIKVGPISQLVGEIPAAVFRPHAFDTAITMDTATHEHPLTFRVRYVGTSLDGAAFFGTIVGASVTDHQTRMMVLPLQSIQLGA